jgi:PAS domain S-box-containing protein
MKLVKANPLIGKMETVAALQSARDDLERRDEERTQELAQSLSLLNATLESTADGILVVDRNQRVASYNSRFVEMWRLPREEIASGEDDRVLPLVVKQMKDSQAFLAKVHDLYAKPEAESFDTLELKDGRIFERVSRPQRLNGECVGRVWSFRDITEHKRTEEELFELQALYHSLVDQMPAGVFRKDAAGRYVFVNSWFCRIKGATPDQILGKTPGELAASESPGQNAKHSKEIQFMTLGVDHHKLIMENGRRIEVEEEYPGVDGKMVHLHVVKSPVFDPDGKIIGTQGMLFDVTEQKHVEAELSHERDLLRALLDNSPDPIYFKDLQSRFLKTSQHLVKFSGMKDVNDLVGKTDFDFFTEEHARPAFQDEQEIIRTGRPMVGKVEKETLKDGRVSWALTSKMPLRNKDGQIIGTFGISKDITAIKETEAKLEQMHKELLETSRLAGMAEIATNVLHNVGNVLNSVNVSASLVVDNVKKCKIASLAKVAVMLREHEHDLGTFITSDAKGRQLPVYLGQLAEQLLADQTTTVQELDLLVKNIEHIKDIVSMQQSYARVSGVKEIINLRELVEDSLRMNEGALARHRVEVIREFGDVPLINIDKHKVLQILVNLIRNAKYACDESGREDKQMTVRVANGEGRIKISVADNGIGVPPENLIRIFNHGFTTRKDGHGFGLHSGALAAKEMGGSLAVQSDGPGKGSNFTLELPVQTKSSA